MPLARLQPLVLVKTDERTTPWRPKYYHVEERNHRNKAQKGKGSQKQAPRRALGVPGSTLPAGTIATAGPGKTSERTTSWRPQDYHLEDRNNGNKAQRYERSQKKGPRRAIGVPGSTYATGSLATAGPGKHISANYILETNRLPS